MFRSILVAAAMLAFGSSSLAGDELLKLVHTIALDGVQGRFDHFAWDAEGKRIFVAALGNNSVEIVDVEKASRLTGIGNIKEPQGLHYVSESKRLAAASGGDGNLRIYDDAQKLLGTISDLDDADNVRYDAKAKLLYVGYGSGALAIVDPEKVAKVGEIKLDGHPESFQLEANNNRIFVNVPSAKQIAVVDRERKTVVAKWPMNDAAANFPMALDEPNHRLFVGCRKPSKLLVLDTENGKTVATVDCCGDTDDVFFDAAAKRIYVTGGEGCISLIKQSDANHYEILGKIPTAAGARTSLFVPATRMLFVAVPHRGNQRAEIRAYQAEKP